MPSSSGTCGAETTPENLTAAEREVVHAVLLGQSTAEIALSRRSSPRTIANLLARAYRKAGVTSRFELAVVAGVATSVPGDASQLSEREQEVLAHLVRGRCNKAIAYELRVTEGSVATYLKRAAAKLGVQGRMMLIQRCRQLRAAGGLPEELPVSGWTRRLLFDPRIEEPQ